MFKESEARVRSALFDIAGATNDLCKMNSENEAAYSFTRDWPKESLAALKEKGLVE